MLFCIVLFPDLAPSVLKPFIKNHIDKKVIINDKEENEMSNLHETEYSNNAEHMKSKV